MKSELYFSALLVPFFIALAGTQLGPRLKTPSERMGLIIRGWANRLGLFGGVMFAVLALFPQAKFPPEQVEGWLFYLATISLFWSFLEVKVRKGRRPLRLLLFMLAWPMLLSPKLSADWTVLLLSVWVVGLGAICAAFWKFTEDKLSRLSPGIAGLLLAGNSGVAAVVLLASGGFHLGLAAGAVSVSMLPFAVSAFRDQKLFMAGLLSLQGVVLTSLLLIGYHFSQVPALCMILLLAPATASRGLKGLFAPMIIWIVSLGWAITHGVIGGASLTF